jgi:energy-coupling factor transporter transmembrane protein EcfT
VKSTALSPREFGRIAPTGPILATTVVAAHRRKMALAAAAEIRGRNTTTN